MIESPIFWTDVQQAQERLVATVILYDGSPYFVVSAENGADGKPRLYLMECGNETNLTRKVMDSPKFKRFRELPQIGWMNYDKGTSAHFFERGARRSRQHGLSDSNISHWGLTHGTITNLTSRRDLSEVMHDKGFIHMVKDEYPTLTSILAKIVDNTAIAYSRRYCVYRDVDGVRWLYRNTDRIGLFTGANTLNLLSKHSFYREEIMADEKFTLDKIQEF